MASPVATPASAGFQRTRTKEKEVNPMEIVAFSAMIVLWIGFAVLLFFSQSSIDNMWTWFKDRSVVVQVPLGFLFLPWVAGTWIWESSWPLVARGMLVAGVACANIYTFSPWKPFS
jgi:hypothetical protein